MVKQNKTTDLVQDNVVKQTNTADGLEFTASTLTTAGYCQVVPMTFEEKVKMYMRCTKLELARMMASRDHIDELRPCYPQPYPYPWAVPCTPVDPVYPYTYPTITCEGGEEQGTINIDYNTQYADTSGTYTITCSAKNE